MLKLILANLRLLESKVQRNCIFSSPRDFGMEDVFGIVDLTKLVPKYYNLKMDILRRKLGLGSGKLSPLVAQMVKRLPGMQETQVRFLGWEDPLEEMATHSSTLAWKIPWTEEPGRLQSMGSQRVRHD